MVNEQGNLSIDSENIFPIIKKWLYSDHDIFIRELVSNGCDAITKLKQDLNLPASIRDFGVDEKTFMDKLDELVELAYDDQCTGANPVYPLMDEIKQIYIDAYHGVV